MKQNELTETFMLISNYKKPFGLHDLYNRYFRVSRVNRSKAK